MATEVRHSDSLPAPRQTPPTTVTRGYAVKHQGPGYENDWLYFAHLEPAWAYGRAAGMSVLTARWFIRLAALAVTTDPDTGRVSSVLHLAGLVPWNTEGVFDSRTLERWLEGIQDSSPRWQPLR